MSDVDLEQDAKLYHDLRRMAAYYLKMERQGHTLQPTALVHEAVLRVYGGKMPEPFDQKQIIAALARAMRQILVDYARKRTAAKRCFPERGPAPSHDSASDESYRLAADVLTIEEALKELAASSERQERVVELRYFAGMTEEETAEVLNVSRETVKRDWRFAQAWLKRRLQNGFAQEAAESS
jgi:RNA polymerase sigma factor (TIGR02999 family)